MHSLNVTGCVSVVISFDHVLYPRVTSVYMFKHFLVIYANRFEHFHTQLKNDIQTKKVLQGLENILRRENSFFGVNNAF